MVVSTKEEKPGAWRGGEEGFTERDICVKEQGRGICECLEECPGQKTQLVKMPGVPETLSSGVNERGVRGWVREETPGVPGAAPLPGEKPLGLVKLWRGVVVSPREGHSGC